MHYRNAPAALVVLTTEEKEVFTEKEKALPLMYKEIKLDIGYSVDLLVANKVIIEIKTVVAFAGVHTAQVLTYLKLSGCKIGLLLNFHTAHLKDGLKRLVLLNRKAQVLKEV